jgi:hypothetical protein
MSKQKTENKQKELKLKPGVTFKTPIRFNGSKFGNQPKNVGGFDPGRFKTQHKG